MTPKGCNINGRVYSNTALNDLILRMKNQTLKFNNVELLGELSHPSRNWNYSPNEISMSFLYDSWSLVDEEAFLNTRRKKVNLNFKN